MIGSSNRKSQIANRKSGKGFTLMEILVVMAFFAVLVVVLVNVFLLALRAQRQAAFRQETLDNLRFISETITRQIRNSQIYYYDPNDPQSPEYDIDGEAGISGPEQELHLIDGEGNNYVYYLDVGEIKVAINGEESKLTTISDVTVVKLLFFIDPETNPFIEERCNAAHT
ncbi:prepilin-type N-terminal cleavage/methylation domain-containing protein, partial [Candidatus Falkowbacteria bacterium]|nr:prepilin-type N-terminal cleavage/methylation domain-containing protein [Candidatus Falkowbacteria bacterium]